MMSVAMLRRLRRVLIALLGLGLVLLLLWAAVVVPPRLIDTSGIADPAKRLDEVNALRTNLLGLLAGLAVVAGTAVGALNLRETQRQNRAVLEVERRGQVTERFTRAIEQLGQHGDEKLDVRIGAVYALEQIAQDSDELHWPIMEVLTAYLREHARAGPVLDALADGADRRPPADHQAIATVIGRRRRIASPWLPGTAAPYVAWAGDLKREPGSLNLRRVSLPGVDWAFAHLEEAHLEEARLEGAELWGAHLEGAYLDGAHLEGARLSEAHVEHTRLIGAHLERADVGWSRLEGANLTDAHLEGAIFQGPLCPELASRVAGAAEAAEPSEPPGRV
jgi:hypothetical protein